jgi:hypothetical protein
MRTAKAAFHGRFFACIVHGKQLALLAFSPLYCCNAKEWTARSMLRKPLKDLHVSAPTDSIYAEKKNRRAIFLRHPNLP